VIVPTHNRWYLPGQRPWQRAGICWGEQFGAQGEAARQPPRLHADKFNPDQVWQLTLAACIQLLNGGHGFKV